MGNQQIEERDRVNAGSSVRFGSAALFALTPLVVGMADAGLSLHYARPATYETPATWAPAWVFPVAWLVLYPTLGLSAFCVWRAGADVDVRGSLAVYALYMLGNLFFMPISGAIGGAPLVLTMMDLNGVLATVVLAWAAACVSRSALAWLTPLALWMPVTFVLKVWLTLANR